MNAFTFISGNTWRQDEAQRLLSGLTVHRSRLTVDKGRGETLEEIATARVLDGYRQLQSPCAVENSGLFLESNTSLVGARFKKVLLELGEDEFARQYGGHRGITRIVVAYTDDGKTVQLFEGQNEGFLLDAPRGEGGYGWDRLWVPNGFTRTLAELRGSKYVVNMRVRPLLELGAMLRSDGFGGVFESHVTVAPCDETQFAAACDALGCKYISIDLPRGTNAHQPMTGAHHQGEYREVIREVHQLAEAIARRGFTVVRTKLEAVGRHKALPLTDDEASRAPKTNYFEHHAKVVLPSREVEAALTERFRAVGAHLSSNARKHVVDGPQERFLTVRSWGLGQLSADARFEQVLALARELQLPLKNRVREYTVYDSGLDIDQGWM